MASTDYNGKSPCYNCKPGVEEMSAYILPISFIRFLFPISLVHLDFPFLLVTYADVTMFLCAVFDLI